MILTTRASRAILFRVPAGQRRSVATAVRGYPHADRPAAGTAGSSVTRLWVTGYERGSAPGWTQSNEFRHREAERLAILAAKGAGCDRISLRGGAKERKITRIRDNRIKRENSMRLIASALLLLLPAGAALAAEAPGTIAEFALIWPGGLCQIGRAHV